MRLAGKLEPNAEKMEEFYSKGFEFFEMYLSTSILDERSVGDIVSVCERANGEFVTVHTPHISTEIPFSPYFRKTDEIAAELDAVLVFDSNPTSTRYAPNMYPTSDVLAPQMGYENDPSVSKYYLRNYHLEKGWPLVLDTAHLHMSEETYIPFIELLLQTCTLEELPAIHIAEATRHADGLPFGEGAVDVERVVNLIDTYDYEGPVILEFPQSSQIEALDNVRSYLE